MSRVLRPVPTSYHTHRRQWNVFVDGQPVGAVASAYPFDGTKFSIIHFPESRRSQIAAHIARTPGASWRMTFSTPQDAARFLVAALGL